MGDHFAKFLRDTGLALLTVLLTGIEQYVNTGGLEGTKFAAYAAVILIALNVVRRLIFGATDVPKEDPNAGLAIANDGPPVIVSDAAANNEVLASVARSIAYRTEAATPAEIKTLDPMLFLTVLSILIKIIQSCPKPAADIYADATASKGFFAGAKRRLIRAVILRAIPSTHKTIKAEIADSILEELNSSTLAEFEQFVNHVRAELAPVAPAGVTFQTSSVPAVAYTVPATPDVPANASNATGSGVAA